MRGVLIATVGFRLGICRLARPSRAVPGGPQAVRPAGSGAGKPTSFGGESFPIASEHRYATLKYSDLALTCSGTATLEVALLETPMIVIYKLAFFSWALGKLIVKVPHVSLTNLVAGKRLVPEFLQGAVDPVTLAREAGSLLQDDTRREQIVEELKRIRAKLGGGGASERAARLALSLMSG